MRGADIGEKDKNLSSPDKEGRRLLFEVKKKKGKRERRRNYEDIEGAIKGLTSRQAG